MSQFKIHKAERKRLKARVGISGPSGSGKTYSALLIARGIAGPTGRICVLDTEQESSSMYAALAGGFDVLPLAAPYSPARYMAALDAIEAEGYDVVVVDQITNEWNGVGGILEMVDKAKQASRGSDFAAWNGPSQLHRTFIDRLLAVGTHLVVTLRSKTAYVLESKNGKNVPKKVGMAPEQRDGIEYEFQIMLDLSHDGNTASVSKDRTSLFAGTNFTPTIKTGEEIRAFLDSGAALVPAEPKAVQKPAPAVAPAPEPTAAEEDGAIAADQEAASEVISPAQAKVIFTAAKNHGVSMADLKALVKRVAGVESSQEIPVSKFLPILDEIGGKEEVA